MATISRSGKRAAKGSSQAIVAPLSHQVEWLLACKNGTPTGSPFDSYAGLLTEANHLGNVAYRTGHKIVWDTANMRVTNTSAAEPFIRRQPRDGWKLGGLA